MIFNRHSHLKGFHATMSASQYHWINYDMDKFESSVIASQAARHGTELHEFAHECIRLGVKLLDVPKTLNMYVNDAIGFRMSSEQVLFYSENFFCTADAISFRDNFLRIHDLKTGVTPGSVHQLEVNAAAFCLEYKVKPTDIDMEFRLYQNDDKEIFEGDADAVTHIISQAIAFDKRIKAMRLEGLA